MYLCGTAIFKLFYIKICSVFQLTAVREPLVFLSLCSAFFIYIFPFHTVCLKRVFRETDLIVLNLKPILRVSRLRLKQSIYSDITAIVLFISHLD